MKNKPYPLYPGFEIDDNFYHVLSYCCDQYDSKTAITFRKGKDIEKRSFTQLFTDTLKLTTYISHLGLKNTNIAIVSPNSYVWVVAFFAIQFSGNVVVPMNNNFSSEEIVELIQRNDVGAAFVSGKVALPQDLCLISDIDLILESSNELEEYRDCFISEGYSMIFFTSGSTGHCKGVVLSQQNICFDVFCMSKYCYPHNAHVAMQTLPLYHTLGLSTFIFYLIHGMETFIERSPRYLMKDLKEASPSVSTWVPAIADGIYNSIIQKLNSPFKRLQYRLMKFMSRSLLFCGIDARRFIFRRILDALGGNLKFVCVGGASLRDKVIQEYRAWGIYVMHGYGITECSPVISVNRNYYWHDGSVGIVLPDIAVKIAPDGEILVKGRNVFSGYYGDVESTQGAFDSDGWFKTGDIGYVDRNGFLYITGRKKNIIILSSGENVCPEELESKLEAYFPNILEAIVFEENDRIVAEVYVDNAELRSEVSSGLNAFNRTLQAFMHIHEVRFRDKAFPKTGNGKIIRTYQGVDKHV